MKVFEEQEVWQLESDTNHSEINSTPNNHFRSHRISRCQRVSVQMRPVRRSISYWLHTAKQKKHVSRQERKRNTKCNAPRIAWGYHLGHQWDTSSSAAQFGTHAPQNLVGQLHPRVWLLSSSMMCCSSRWWANTHLAQPTSGMAAR